MLSPPGEYVAKLKEEGFVWHGVQVGRNYNQLGDDFIGLFQLAKIYISQQPHIVNHYGLKCIILGGIASWLARSKNRVNIVTGLGYVFSGGNYLRRIMGLFINCIMVCIMRLPNTINIVQNPDDLKMIIQKGWSGAENTQLIPGSGVSLQKFQPSSFLFTGNYTVLCATRLLKEKGIYEYVAAARILKEKNYSIKFLLAGYRDVGNPGVISGSEIESWQKEHIIEYLGHCNDMPRLLQRTNLVVLPSYREGIPRILLEAAACRLPIITSDVPGCRQLIENHVNGLLVPAKNAEALAKAISYMYEHPTEAARMGEKARLKVVAEYEVGVISRQFINLYNQLR